MLLSAWLIRSRVESDSKKRFAAELIAIVMPGPSGGIMNISIKASACAILAGMVALASPAQATQTFAQFVQASANTPIFTYTNTNSGGILAKLTTTPGSNTFLIANLGSLLSPSLATVNLTASATALPTVGVDIRQLFSGSITFTLLAPQLGLSGPSTDALTVTFTNAILLAAPGGSAPTLQTDPGSTITYQSDFIDLSGVLNKDFSLSFSGATVPLTMVGPRLPDFSVSGSGTFAAVMAVPEPGSWGMMLGGFAIVGAALRARRRAAVSFG